VQQKETNIKDLQN